MLKNLKARHAAYTFLSTSLLLIAFITSAGSAAAAGTAIQVAVNVKASLGTIPDTAFGLNTAAWDAHLLDPSVAKLLRQANVNVLRFPGGSTADFYHWKTNTVTSTQYGSINPNDTFDAFMKVANQAGARPMLTVNYGSNAAGTGGGDPQEAADWVRYANITKHYHVQYWEIGNEVYGNGSYGSQWEVDLHKEKGPVAYANNALTFIRAMKAVDPSIQIGVVLIPLGIWPYGIGPDWNSNVLSIACQALDFVDIHWYPQEPGKESDAGLLSSPTKIAGVISNLRDSIKAHCGTRASQIKIMLTETNSVSYNPGKQTVSPTNALFLADNYMNWLENGVANVDWWDIHNSITTGQNNSPALYGDARYGDYGILSSGESSAGMKEPPMETPFPAYYGLQMLNKLAGSGGEMIHVSSDQNLLAVHAVRQNGNRLALLLINKDPSRNFSVTFSLKGYTPASSATIYFYGKSSPTLLETQDPAFKDTLSEDIPPYSLLTIVAALQPATK